MKLFRFGSPGAEKPGVIDADGNRRSLEGVVDDLTGEALTNTGLEELRRVDVDRLPLVDDHERYGPSGSTTPITRKSRAQKSQRNQFCS